MNCLNIIGRAVAQPTLKYVGPTNRAVAEFTLAYDDPYSKSGDTRKSYFFYVVIWGQKAEYAHKYIVKGQQVGITGELTQESFIPAGQTKPTYKTRIVANSFNLLAKPKSHDDQSQHQSQAQRQSQPAADAGPPPEEDDIPF